MEANKFIGKVLTDGHLSLPDEVSKQVGKIFEVILLPINQNQINSYTEMLSKEKGFIQYTEKEIEKIIHESRGVSD